MAEELWRYSAHELAGMIRQREVSSREVVMSHLARIEAVNPAVNAVTVALADSALAAADAADGTSPQGIFHGVPFSIKENIDCVGSATTQGLPAFAEALPEMDAPVVERMKAAGAIPLARTNLPEMAFRITTDNPLHGCTNNPFDPTRTAGGSSGGEGAALATGMSPLGLGNDIGGSLRNPAFCCGITSLKPTTGRIPAAGSIPGAEQPIGFRLMAVEGPMARSVADLRLALSVLAGWHVRDPFSVTAPLTGAAAPRKAALVTEMPFTRLPASFVAAIHRAGQVLEEAGWQVAEVEVPELARVNEIWGRVLAADIEAMLPLLSQLMSERPVNLLQGLLAKYDPAALHGTQVFMERDRLAMAWSRMFVDWPVVIGPTWADQQFLHDADLDPESGIETTLNRLQFITPGNLLGIPSVALPCGTAAGLPLGVQVYAERWREDLCLEAAELIEAAVGSAKPVDPVV